MCFHVIAYMQSAPATAPTGRRACISTTTGRGSTGAISPARVIGGVPPPVVVDWVFELCAIFSASAEGGLARNISEWGRSSNDLPFLFDHDPDYIGGYIKKDGGLFKFEPLC